MSFLDYFRVKPTIPVGQPLPGTHLIEAVPGTLPSNVPLAQLQAANITPNKVGLLNAFLPDLACDRYPVSPTLPINAVHSDYGVYMPLPGVLDPNNQDLAPRITQRVIVNRVDVTAPETMDYSEVFST